MIAALTTTQRIQTLQMLTIDNMVERKSGYKFENTELVKQLTVVFGKPDIDAFASRLNC